MRRMFAQALREIRERGYEIRPHSYKHSSYFLFISEAEILDDLTRLEYEMRLTGVPYTRVWRPPYGSHSEAHRRAAEALGLVRDTWNIDSQDWTYHADAPFSEFFELFSRWRAVVLQRLRDEIRSGAGNGDVAEVLLHVNSRTAETLPEIVSAIANDYRETYGAESWGIDRPIFFVTRGR
jgi:peptidoglycan/xylan/chitin deacetylase (PgdA/CDA1 family)